MNGEKMDHYNQQQGNSYQQGTQYQQENPCQQGNPYQQGMPCMSDGGGSGGSARPQKAPNIFQQFVFAFIPTRYDRLTKVKTGRMIGFVTLLVLIASVLTFINVALGLASLNMEEWVYQLPAFTISDGHLSIEEDFLFDEDGAYVYVTDEVDEFSNGEATEIASRGYRNIILVGRDRILVVQNTGYLNWQYIDFGVLGSNTQIDRDWIVSVLFPFVKRLVVATYFIVFLTGVLGYFLGAAVYLLFAMLIAAIMKKNLKTGALFRTAVYAKVLMFVVSTLIGLIPFAGISVPFLLKAVITIGFMAFAIAKLPDNRPVPVQMGQWGQSGQNDQNGQNQGWQ